MREKIHDFRVREAHLNKRRYPRPLKEINDTTGAFRVPQDPVSPIGEVTRQAGIDWRIYWYTGLTEAGVFKVDFIVRTPETTPALPHLPKVMEIFGSACHHVECVPEFVCAGAGWRYWVVGLTSKICSIQSLLLGPRPKCGCDPWLNSRTSSEVYEALREWLKRFDQGSDIRTH